MRIDQLHADADLLRQHSLPLSSATRHATEPVETPMPDADEDWNAAHRWTAHEAGDARPMLEHSGNDGTEESMPRPSQRPALFEPVSDAWPAPPPPPDEAMARTSWIARLASIAARSSARRDADMQALSGESATTSQRQFNLAPWLAAGVVAIVLLALGAGLLSHRRIDAEAAQLVDARRRAAEQALSLLHATERPLATASTSHPQQAAPDATLESEPTAPTRGDTPADTRARHDAMLASIKSGTVLAPLPPSALAQPTPLPAELPPVAAAASAPRGAAPASPRPAKKVALIVEGSPAPVARAAALADPLAATAVRATLKGATNPQHRVYQLRESDGEWLGFVARADADPLAVGVWAGSGDLLTGGWRVAEVTAQRLTLVGANGALEILRP